MSCLSAGCNQLSQRPESTILYHCCHLDTTGNDDQGMLNCHLSGIYAAEGVDTGQVASGTMYLTLGFRSQQDARLFGSSHGRS